MRTIQRHFVRMELTGLPGAGTAPDRSSAGSRRTPPGSCGSPTCCTARRPAPPPKTYLFGIEDDHSRFITGGGGPRRRITTGLFAALRRAVEAHGAPRAFYVDNGSPYVSRQLLHALAVLGIQITHSRPRRPQGKGKIERLFETVRAQFLVEVAAAARAGGHVAEVGDRPGGAVRRLGAPGLSPGGARRDRAGPGRAVRRRAGPGSGRSPRR